MLPLLKTLLEADFPGIEVLPIDAFPAGQRADRHGGDGGARQGERRRRRHHRQRGLRGLRHSMRPCSRQDRSAGDSHRHADAGGFRRGHEERRRPASGSRPTRRWSPSRSRCSCPAATSRRSRRASSEFYDGLTRWTLGLCRRRRGRAADAAAWRARAYEDALRAGQSPDARQPLGRRPAAVARRRGSASTGSCAAPRCRATHVARQVSAARRRHHGRDAARSRSRWRAGGPSTCRCWSRRSRRSSIPSRAASSCRPLRAARFRW